MKRTNLTVVLAGFLVTHGAFAPALMAAVTPAMKAAFIKEVKRQNNISAASHIFANSGGFVRTKLNVNKAKSYHDIKRTDSELHPLVGVIAEKGTYYMTGVQDTKEQAARAPYNFVFSGYSCVIKYEWVGGRWKHFDIKTDLGKPHIVM